jgi:hypothetical protein
MNSDVKLLMRIFAMHFPSFKFMLTFNGSKIYEQNPTWGVSGLNRWNMEKIQKACFFRGEEIYLPLII